MAFRRTVRSDELPRFQAAAKLVRVTSPVGPSLEPRHTVIDANHILAGVRFQVKRAAMDWRAHFEELAAAGVLKVYAPAHLPELIERKLQQLETKQRLPLEQTRAVWNRMRHHIHFMPVADDGHERWEPLRQRDLEDLPFALLVEFLGADGLLTADHDFEAAPPEVANRATGREELEPLKYLAREHARELSAKTTTNGAALAATHGVLLLAKALTHGPWWFQFAFGATAAVFLFNEKVRTAVAPWAEKLAFSVGSVFAEAIEESAAAERAAVQHQETVQSVWPERPRLTLAQHLTRELHERPHQRLFGLEQNLRARGLVTGPQGQTRHTVLRTLKTHPRFAQDRDRFWCLSHRTPSAVVQPAVRAS